MQAPGPCEWGDLNRGIFTSRGIHHQTTMRVSAILSNVGFGFYALALGSFIVLKYGSHLSPCGLRNDDVFGGRISYEDCVKWLSAPYGSCTRARLGVFCRSPFDGRPQGGGHLEPPARDSSGGCPGFIYPLGPGTYFRTDHFAQQPSAAAF